MISDDKRTAEKIERLRNMGLDYRKIGIALDIPRDKVRNYCKTHGLDGCAKKRLQAREGKQMEAVCADSVCRQCGKPLGEKSAGRKRIYCSDECCGLWVKNHPSLYKHECMFCGKEYESQTKNQKFCSHDCYIRNRFWRQEDTEEIMKLILTGKKVPMVPKWLKDILNDETK